MNVCCFFFSRVCKTVSQHERSLGSAKEEADRLRGQLSTARREAAEAVEELAQSKRHLEDLEAVGVHALVVWDLGRPEPVFHDNVLAFFCGKVKSFKF